MLETIRKPERIWAKPQVYRRANQQEINKGSNLFRSSEIKRKALTGVVHLGMEDMRGKCKVASSRLVKV